MLSANVDIFNQLLLGINYIHAMGIIHRDLKVAISFLIFTLYLIVLFIALFIVLNIY